MDIAMQEKPLRLVLIGWGAINSRVSELLNRRGCPVEIVGVAKRGTPRATYPLPLGAKLLSSERDMSALKPDLVIEAAGRAAVAQWAPVALAAAPAVIISSTSAFCDPELLASLTNAAKCHGSRIVLPSGAIGGMDALGGLAVLGLNDVLHQIIKPPQAWKSTQAEALVDLDRLTERTIFFSGSARDAAVSYPRSANATVVTALAGIGLDRTRVEMIADPGASMNEHTISAHGAFGRMQIVLQNAPLLVNPKSSELAASSLVRLVEQRVSNVNVQ